MQASWFVMNRARSAGEKSSAECAACAPATAPGSAATGIARRKGKCWVMGSVRLGAARLCIGLELGRGRGRASAATSAKAASRAAASARWGPGRANIRARAAPAAGGPAGPARCRAGTRARRRRGRRATIRRPPLPVRSSGRCAAARPPSGIAAAQTAGPLLANSAQRLAVQPHHCRACALRRRQASARPTPPAQRNSATRRRAAGMSRCPPGGPVVEQPAAAGAGAEPVGALDDLAAVMAMQLHHLAGAVLDAHAAGVAQRRHGLPDVKRRPAASVTGGASRPGTSSRHRSRSTGHWPAPHAPTHAAAHHEDFARVPRDVAIGHDLVRPPRHRRAQRITAVGPAPRCAARWRPGRRRHLVGGRTCLSNGAAQSSRLSNSRRFIAVGRRTVRVLRRR